MYISCILSSSRLTGLEVFLTSAVLGIRLKPHSGDLKVSTVYCAI